MLRETMYEALYSFTSSLSELTALFSSYPHSNKSEILNAIGRTLAASEKLIQELNLLEQSPPLYRIRAQRIISATIKLTELISKLVRLHNLPELRTTDASQPSSPTSQLAIELTTQYFSIELGFFNRLKSDFIRAKDAIPHNSGLLYQASAPSRFIELANARDMKGDNLFSRSAGARDQLLKLEAASQADSDGTHTSFNTFVPVFYATDRAYDANSKPPHCQFLDRRAENSLTYGIAEVSIPPIHRRGHIERPFSLWKIQFKEKIDCHIVITSCNCLPIEDWKNHARDKLCEMASKSALVFIHGFNVSFDDAIRQTAQIGFDLQLQSLIASYSWSSQGAMEDYAADEDSVKLTVPRLIKFLSTLQSIGITTIHVIAHSMGNRALLEALGNTTPPLSEVVMAAPDVDATLFRESVPQFTGKANRYTLYGSASDKAIQISKKVHAGYPRAGDGGDNILVLNGVETVDASKVGSDLFGLGHSYYANKPRVLSDLYYLLRESLPASRREGLGKMERDSLPFWFFI